MFHRSRSLLHSRRLVVDNLLLLALALLLISSSICITCTPPIGHRSAVLFRLLLRLFHGLFLRLLLCSRRCQSRGLCLLFFLTSFFGRRLFLLLLLRSLNATLSLLLFICRCAFRSVIGAFALGSGLKDPEVDVVVGIGVIAIAREGDGRFGRGGRLRIPGIGSGIGRRGVGYLFGLLLLLFGRCGSGWFFGGKGRSGGFFDGLGLFLLLGGESGRLLGRARGFLGLFRLLGSRRRRC
mmetsp:Transcript_5441/g.10506  ORF Transcript_5441/g.10506 Transcript_5441/m.10506 type:complete len:238 (+) Transcript_5441:1565-2278(+)